MRKELQLSWKMLNKLAGQHIPLMLVQMVVFGMLNCYNVAVAPLAISKVYQALENQSISELYLTCGIGGVLIAVFFILCYVNNVYLDINSFGIVVTSSRNACKFLFNLRYDGINKKFSEAEVLNRVDACTRSMDGVLVLFVSILSNVISIILLLFIAGKSSIVLLLLVMFVAGCSYLVSKYESGYKANYERKKQQATDETGALLLHAVTHVAFSKMYEKPEKPWNSYQEQREELWKSKWKQEQVGMYSNVFMEMLTSALRGLFGWSVFGYYRDHKVNSDEVASSFTVFDQLKNIATNFSKPISIMRTCSVAVQRYDELVKHGEKLRTEDMKNTAENMITLKNVSYTAGNRKILKSVNLEIKEKEKVAIIGSNGCGKSTMLRIVAGLYHPEEGTVTVAGKDPGNVTCEEGRENISYIPTMSYMYSQSVRDNIQMNDDNDNEEDLYRVCSLACVPTESDDNILNQVAVTLSGGQMQRVNIARGLINEVPVLLADEPDSGLPLAQGQIVIRNILENSNTTLVITHHCQYLDMFSRVLLFKDGNIILDGTPEEVISSQEYQEWYKGNC